MLAFLLLLLPESKKKGLEMVMLDVGQGDGIAIHFPDGKNLLVDGGSLDVEDLAKYRLEPYLKSRGISRLDYVFVTHGDQDHISGIVQMMERVDRGVKIENLVVPIRDVWEEQLEELVSLAKTKKIRVVEMKEEQILAFSGGTIRCLQPGEMEYPEPGNAASMVLLLSYGKFDLLLTGDVEEEGERMLTEKLASEKEKGVKQKEGQSEKEERSRNRRNRGAESCSSWFEKLHLRRISFCGSAGMCAPVRRKEKPVWASSRRNDEPACGRRRDEVLYHRNGGNSDQNRWGKVSDLWLVRAEGNRYNRNQIYRTSLKKGGIRYGDYERTGNADRDSDL